MRGRSHNLTPWKGLTNSEDFNHEANTTFTIRRCDTVHKEG